MHTQSDGFQNSTHLDQNLEVEFHDDRNLVESVTSWGIKVELRTGKVFCSPACWSDAACRFDGLLKGGRVIRHVSWAAACLTRGNSLCRELRTACIWTGICVCAPACICVCLCRVVEEPHHSRVCVYLVIGMFIYIFFPLFGFKRWLNVIYFCLRASPIKV